MKRVRIGKTSLIVIIVLFVVVTSLIVIIATGRKRDIGAVKTFDCDVKVFRLNTDIQISSDGVYLFSVQGNIIKFLTDPLRLCNSEGKEIASAGDEYHIVTQDTHWILTATEEIKMVGNFTIFGDSYEFFVDDEKVAHAEFNAFNTYGTLVDNDGNIMADYTSCIIFKDYAVQVTNNNIFSDEAINLIFASYYSDQDADSRNNK